MNPTDDGSKAVKDEKKEVLPRSEYIHTRSIRQIAKDAKEGTRPEIKDDVVKPSKEKEEKVDLEDNSEKVKEDKKVKYQEEKEKLESEKAEKIATDAAKKVAEETKLAFKEEIEKILTKDKPLLDKQKEIDELIPVWQKENRIPKDYPEVIAESLRITETKWKQLEDQRIAKDMADLKAAEEKVAKEKEDRDTYEKAQAEEKQKTSVQRVYDDLDYLIITKEFDKPSDMKEIDNHQTQDQAAKDIQKFLNYGIEVNTKLAAEGKPPVTPFKLYHEHYKPHLAAHPETKNNQPAGADAPVSGATNSPTPESTVTPYSRLHNETWAQTKFRLAKEAARHVMGR